MASMESGPESMLSAPKKAETGSEALGKFYKEHAGKIREKPTAPAGTEEEEALGIDFDEAKILKRGAEKEEKFKYKAEDLIAERAEVDIPAGEVLDALEQEFTGKKDDAMYLFDKVLKYLKSRRLIDRAGNVKKEKAVEAISKVKKDYLDILKKI